MSKTKRTKQPEEVWKHWGELLFYPWYDRNQPSDLQRHSELEPWKKWGEKIYIPWYDGRVAAQSNPNDPPPPPPGPR